MTRPSAAIKKIAEEISNEEVEELNKFSKQELCVIIAAIIRYLDDKHVLEQGKEN